MDKSLVKEFADALIVECKGSEPEPEHRFIETRYPYTYAAEYLIACGAADNRSQASLLVSMFATKNDIDARTLSCELADRQLAKLNVAMPTGSA